MEDTEFRLYYGATWLNFVVTLTGRRQARAVERLGSPRRLGEWFAAVGLAPRQPPTRADLVVAIELREALHELARAVVEERRADSRAVRLVNRALAHDETPALRTTRGELRTSAPATARAALGRIARQAAEHLTGPERDRLRGCADPTCSGVFLDDTGRRRWCRDGTCGVRVRVRAHRAREQRALG